MSLTIAYFTNRLDPMIDMFAKSLRREIRDTGFQPDELIIVDYHADEPGRREYIQERVPFGDLAPKTWHISPKPCVWQGAHRFTKNNYFAASNARNTAIARCSSDFIACVDDLSVLAHGWISNVFHAMREQYIVLGAYKKVLNLKVDDIGAISFEPHPSGVDSRWGMGSGEGIVKAWGNIFFGCSFAMPVEAALTVNGFDEICDGQGAEDYDFGIRLERSGRKLFYNRNMLTYESEEGHGSPGNERFIRISKEMNYSGSRIGSDHVLLQRVTNEKRTWTIAKEYTLRALRDHMLAGGSFPIPTSPKYDWRDDKPLGEM